MKNTARLFLVLFILLNLSEAFATCMTTQEIYRLNRIIFCQQAMNPLQCDQFNQYFDSMEAVGFPGYEDSEPEDNPLAMTPQVRTGGPQTDERDLAIATGLTVGPPVVEAAITRAANYPPAIAAYDSAREGMTEVNRIFRQIVSSGSATEAQTSRINQLFQNIRSTAGRHFPTLGRIPAAITQSQLTNAAVAAAGRIAGGALRVAGSGTVGALYLIYELGNYMTAQTLERLNCTAEDRSNAQFRFMCITERCHDHYTSCSNAFNFTLLDPLNQATELNHNPRLCAYMKQVYTLGKRTTENVSLLDCPRPGDGGSAATINVDNYFLGDLSASQYPGWQTHRPETRDVTFKFYFNPSGELDRTLAVFDEQLQPNNPSQFFETAPQVHYNYDSSGNLENFFQITQAYDEQPTPENEHRVFPFEMGGRNITRSDLIPPEELGWANGFFQSSTHRDWASSQNFLFHRMISDLYHETRRCCFPQAGETCDLSRTRVDNPDIRRPAVTTPSSS